MSDLLDRALARRDDLVAQASKLVDTAEAENRALTPTENAAHTDLLGAISAQGTRIAELQASEAREHAANEARRLSGDVNVDLTVGRLPRASITYQAATYRPSDQGGTRSWFADAYAAQRGNRDAAERLARNDREVRETRALSNNLGAGGSGGELAPPGWMVDKWVELARPSRPVANLCKAMPLPSGVSSVNLPKIATGTSAQVQAAQNTALSQTDLTTTALTGTICTIGGKQVIAQQLIDQAGVDFDEAVLSDLSAEVARQVDQQVIGGIGSAGQMRGLLNVVGIGTVAYTDASPSAAGPGKLLARMAAAMQTVHTTRYLPIEAWIMTPARWAWLCASTDTALRPLIVPEYAGPTNANGVVDRVAAENVVGRIHGVPVVVDSSLPTNLGAGTNQEPLIGLRASDAWLYESEMRAEVFTATYADQLSVLVRCYQYATLLVRYPASVVQLSGTGTIYPPTF